MKRFFAIVALMGVFFIFKFPLNKISVTISDENGVILCREFKYEKLTMAEIFTGVDYGKKFTSSMKDGNTLEVSLNGVVPDFGSISSGIILSKYVAPQNASVIFRPEDKGLFEYTAEMSGSMIDEEAFISDIAEGLDNGNINIMLKKIPIEADVKIDDLKASTVLRSTFKTSYSTSSASRKSNIALAAKIISGTVIAPGEQFSFNNTVGARSSARGFKEAKIIKDGKFVAGVGGGVCQVSTTLYNAALLSDLQIDTASRHSLTVSYVEPSFDAMVSSVSDLKFTNTTESPLYIRAVTNGTTITFEIYGAPLDYTEIKRESTSQKNISFKVIYVADETVLEGEQKLLSAGIKGTESKGYLCYYSDGKLIKKVNIRHDYYLSTDAVVAVNPNDLKQQ